MENYSLLKVFVDIFIVSYLIGGMLTVFLPKGEVFPLFSWSIFEKVPNDIQEYRILIHEYNGEKFNPPRFYQEARGSVCCPDSVVAKKTIQTMGKAQSKKNLEEFKKEKERFEGNFLNESGRYELVLVVYDPIEMWKTGKFKIKNRFNYTVGGLND